MVSFTCDKCGNGFRKNQVESHMYQCGSRKVSCIDCSTNFRDDEFKTHIRCITESEKYERKSSYVQKANKGDIKQNAWFENVLNAVENFRGSERARNLLEKLTEFPNIPRKKAKFYNFMHNSFRSYGVNDGLLGEIWNVIDSFDKKAIQAAPTKQVIQESLVESETKCSKRKLEDKIEEVDNKKSLKSENTRTKFNWIELSKSECLKREENQVLFKKLFKKIFKNYKKTAEAASSEIEVSELKNKLIKKLKKKSSMFELSNQANSSDLDTILVKFIS